MSVNFCSLCAAAMEPTIVDSEQRLACSADDCAYVYYPNPAPVAAGIVQIGDAVVLAHNVAWPAHWYSINTGFVEENEHPADAAVREVREELGIETRVQGFVGHYIFAQKNELIIAFHLLAEADAQIQLNHELDDYKLVPISKLQPWPGATGDAVKDWLQLMPL